MQKPFNVKDITDLPETPDDNVTFEGKLGLGNYPRSPTAATVAKSTTESELGSFMVLCKDDVSWVKITFVEDSGYQILRIGVEGRDSLDLVLNRNQLKCFLDQTTLWFT